VGLGMAGVRRARGDEQQKASDSRQDHMNQVNSWLERERIELHVGGIDEVAESQEAMEERGGSSAAERGGQGQQRAAHQGAVDAEAGILHQGGDKCGLEHRLVHLNRSKEAAACSQYVLHIMCKDSNQNSISDRIQAQSGEEVDGAQRQADVLSDTHVVGGGREREETVMVGAETREATLRFSPFSSLTSSARWYLASTTPNDVTVTLQLVGSLAMPRLGSHAIATTFYNITTKAQEHQSHQQCVALRKDARKGIIEKAAV
jgi:hypothetical protein